MRTPSDCGKPFFENGLSFFKRRHNASITFVLSDITAPLNSAELAEGRSVDLGDLVLNSTGVRPFFWSSIAKLENL